jgi:peptidyl-prolyl cis-trans isomerase NIMA-interacting 1
VSVRRLSTLAAALALNSCVLTTHEAPSEPPRGAVQPIWPPLGEPPATPISNEGEEPAQGTTAARPETIAARHILVMHRAGMRAPDTITRSKEEAKKRADEALKRARAGEDFVKLVGEYSDEPGAKARGGTLGRFPRGVMVKEFENAAFALEPGQISDVIESPFGFHVIQRTE